MKVLQSVLQVVILYIVLCLECVQGFLKKIQINEGRERSEQIYQKIRSFIIFVEMFYFFFVGCVILVVGGVGCVGWGLVSIDGI